MALTGGSVANSFSGATSTGGGFYVTWQNIDLITSILSEVEDSLRKQETKELRASAKQIAKDVVIPALKRSAAASPVPIAPAFADTARPKSDRVVMVQIGGVNPKLSGFKSHVGTRRAKKGAGSLKGGREATSKNYRTTLAWGSELGPYPGSKHNHYAVGRSTSWWVRAGTQEAIPGALERYEYALSKIIARAGANR